MVSAQREESKEEEEEEPWLSVEQGSQLGGASCAECLIPLSRPPNSSITFLGNPQFFVLFLFLFCFCEILMKDRRYTRQIYHKIRHFLSLSPPTLPSTFLLHLCFHCISTWSSLQRQSAAIHTCHSLLLPHHTHTHTFIAITLTHCLK